MLATMALPSSLPLAYSRFGATFLFTCCCCWILSTTLSGSSASGATHAKPAGQVLTESQAQKSLERWCEARALNKALDSVSKRSTEGSRRSSLASKAKAPEHGGKCDPCQWIGKHAVGQCEEHCTCPKAGTWVCCRVRKEFSTMSGPEVRRYLKTYVTLTTKQPHKKKYDAMVAKHQRLFSKTIHHWPQFWPWHRYFMLKFENMLRRIDCKVTLPYWDFTVSWMQPWLRPMWNPTHLGGSGYGESQYCVTDGPFRRGKWHVTPSAGGGCLKRHFDAAHRGISPRVLTLGTYTYTKPGHLHMYEKIISVYMHSWVHVTLGGIMATHKSANEPSFWMLHSFADKLWGNWQQRGPAFMRSPFTKLNVTLSEQEDADNFTVADMVDLSDMPSAGAPTGGSRTAICYAGFMSVAKAYSSAHMHALPVPRDYAHEYVSKRLHTSIHDLYRSIIRNRLEKAQFKKMVTEPFGAGYKKF